MQRMIRPHHHDEIVVAIMERLQTAGLGGRRADADLGRALLDAAHHLPARPFLQVDPQQSVGAEKSGEILGQELHDRRQIGEHADVATHALAIFGEFDRDLFDIQQRDAGVVQQRFARRRQCHPLRQPLEQADPEGCFEIVHPFADRGGRDAFARRRPRQILFLAHRDEQSQRGEIDAPKQRVFSRAKRTWGRRRIEID